MHVNKALEQRVYRSASIEEKLRELILEDVLIVETYGKKVGQINGLAVIDLETTALGNLLVSPQEHILVRLE